MESEVGRGRTTWEVWTERVQNTLGMGEGVDESELEGLGVEVSTVRMTFLKIDSDTSWLGHQ